jgi:hypothetical protein
MFHDFYHPLNESGEYGVAKAVTNHASDWTFRGRFGGIALFSV